MAKHFSEQLSGVREMVLRMGGLAEQMTRRVIQALVQRDAALLADVRTMETQVNQLHIEIDEACMRSSRCGSRRPSTSASSPRR